MLANVTGEIVSIFYLHKKSSTYESRRHIQHQFSFGIARWAKGVDNMSICSVKWPWNGVSISLKYHLFTHTKVSIYSYQDLMLMSTNSKYKLMFYSYHPMIWARVGKR